MHTLPKVPCGFLRLILLLGMICTLQSISYAADEEVGKLDPSQLAESALSDTADQNPSSTNASDKEGAELDAPSLFELLQKGGWLMMPIVLMSVIVIAFGIERALALRRSKILPEELVAHLGSFAATSSKFDPQKVYRVCQEFPSSASNIIRTMLLKLGRPHSEVEHSVSEATQREADRLFSNVRWLTLAAAVTPLLGLLGTVWGMIQSFFATANLPSGANKAEALAEGIYVALVTTFAGLAVAIPAAILAHYFEGRIRSRLMQTEELMQSLLPQIERYEGKSRIHETYFQQQSDSPKSREENPQPRPPAIVK